MRGYNKIAITKIASQGFTYSHGTSRILLPRIKSNVKQLNKTTRIIKILQNGCVKIRAAKRRGTLFGRNSQSDFDDGNRNRSLFRLTTMNVYRTKMRKT